MRTDKERPEENTYCIVKGLDAVWAYFCPSKPCLSSSTDGIVVYVNFVCVNDLLIVQDDKILFNDLKLLTYCEQCANIHA